MKKLKVTFGNKEIEQAYLDLNDKDHNKQLKMFIDRAFIDIENNAFCGVEIVKKTILNEYAKMFGKLDNLWKYSLPDAWRLIYTIKNEEIKILNIILDWDTTKRL